MKIIEVEGLKKSFGRVEVLKGLDLSVGEGQIYGFLGRNGAGKSTTIRILVGILTVGSGSVRLFGEDMTARNISLRQRIGYVAQEQNFYPWMTPKTLGSFVSGFYPNWDHKRYEELLKLLELNPNRKVGVFSGGMMAKQALALALAHQPPLLILDEPTAGLDPVARREFFRLVRQQTESKKTTILFSSHLIEEVERVADQVGIIDNGKMYYQGPFTTLTQQVRKYTGFAEPLELEEPFQTLRRTETEIVIRVEEPEHLQQLQDRYPQLQVVPMTLEDIFVDLVTQTRA